MGWPWSALVLLFVVGVPLLGPPHASGQDMAPGATPSTLCATAEPNGARGYSIPPAEASHTSLLLPRALLAPARLALYAGTLPVRAIGGLLAPSGIVDRLARAHARERYFVPVAFVDPSLALNAGFRAAHGNPLDPLGCISYRAAIGGTKKQLYSLTIRSRDVELTPYREGWSYKLLARYEIIPDKHYFGIGNTSRRNDLTYYTRERYLFLGTFRYAQTRSLRWDLTLALHRDQIEPAAYAVEGHKSIERGFPWESSAPGLWIDPQNIQGELALILDHRDVRGQPHAGWKAEGFCGYARGTGGDGIDFVHYGGEGHAYLPLAVRHVLALRLAAEEARTSETDARTGATARIKLTELPALGGRTTLRGYLTDRFIDNGSVLATAEYRYAVSPLVEACLFADFGKVLPRLLDFDFTAIHRSFGAGLNLGNDDLFYFRMALARSDEDIIFTATLEPVFDRVDRRERR